MNSALTAALLSCGALDEALSAATGDASDAAGIAAALPSLKTFNMLLAALARESRLVDAILVVNVMHARGYALDRFSFSPLLTACQRAQQPELAWAVYRSVSQPVLDGFYSHLALALHAAPAQLHGHSRPFGPVHAHVRLCAHQAVGAEGKQAVAQFTDLQAAEASWPLD